MRLIDTHAGEFQDLASNRLGSNAIQHETCEDAARKTDELLRLDILPVEYDGRLDRRGILTGGWQRAIGHHGDSPEGLVKAVSDTRLHELIGKALELSAVVEAWSEL